MDQLFICALGTNNIALFRTTLAENEGPLGTTFRENETTLFENRPITSGLNHTNANPGVE